MRKYLCEKRWKSSVYFCIMCQKIKLRPFMCAWQIACRSTWAIRIACDILSFPGRTFRGEEKIVQIRSRLCLRTKVKQRSVAANAGWNVINLRARDRAAKHIPFYTDLYVYRMRTWHLREKHEHLRHVWTLAVGLSRAKLLLSPEGNIIKRI